MVLILETAAACGVGRIGDAPPPSALQNLDVVVGHDHLGPEMGIDDAVVNLHGVVDDTLDVQVRDLWPRDVHGRPNYILDQNSTVFKDGTNLWGHRVPMGEVHKAPVDDALRCLGIGWRYAIDFIPVYHIGIHDELNLKGRTEIRLKLLELYVHSAGGLAGRPWRRHLWLAFSWGLAGWPGQHRNFWEGPRRSIYELNLRHYLCLDPPP